jgi:hypothetical protein
MVQFSLQWLDIFRANIIKAIFRDNSLCFYSIYDAHSSIARIICSSKLHTAMSTTDFLLSREGRKSVKTSSNTIRGVRQSVQSVAQILATNPGRLGCESFQLFQGRLHPVCCFPSVVVSGTRSSRVMLPRPDGRSSLGKGCNRAAIVARWRRTLGTCEGIWQHQHILAPKEEKIFYHFSEDSIPANVRPPIVFRLPTQHLLSAHPIQKFGCTCH